MNGIETKVKIDMNIMKEIIRKEVSVMTVAAVTVIIHEKLMNLLLHRQIH